MSRARGPVGEVILPDLRGRTADAFQDLKKGEP